MRGVVWAKRVCRSRLTINTLIKVHWLLKHRIAPCNRPSVTSHGCPPFGKNELLWWEQVRNNTVKRRLHLLRQMVQIWQKKNLFKLNTTQVRNPMADKRQIWWSTRHWLKNTARIKMSTFKNRTRAANAVGKTSRRGPVTEILLIGYNKKRNDNHINRSATDWPGPVLTAGDEEETQT